MNFVLDGPLGYSQFGPWWLLEITIVFWFALAAALYVKNGFTNHYGILGLLIIPAWPIVIWFHLLFSGFGFTPYLEPLFRNYGLAFQSWWGYNWYNQNPSGSQAGYNLMYLMHAVGTDLFAVTFMLLFNELSTMGALFCSAVGGLSIQIVWEMTEFWNGTQQMANSIPEMYLRIQHASFTTGSALFSLIPVVLLFLVLHRRTT